MADPIFAAAEGAVAFVDPTEDLAHDLGGPGDAPFTLDKWWLEPRYPEEEL